MHKLNKFIPFLPALLLSVLTLSGCSSEKSEKRVIRVLNCEDYIYECEKEGWWCDECTKPNGKEPGMYVDESEVIENDEGEHIHTKCGSVVEYDSDLMDQFVEYWAETHDGEEIDYVYDTFDTNETMFNELKTGKSTYDVIVPSDYMIQKLLSNNMLHKFEDDKIEDLWSNVSPYLADKFTNIKSEQGVSIYDYAVPYMWGTVGVMYNPNWYLSRNLVESEDEVHELFADWDNLYGEKLKGSFSIKDSVRDTYAVSLIHTFNEDIAKVENNEDLTAIFNKHDTETIKSVKEDMLNLKANAFGFECDSGKTDMTTEKIGANMCWSGDATWAITEAEEKSNLTLYYSVPTAFDGETGKGASNVWFDGLCMPESKDLDVELAEGFIEFMCDPENAAQNCDCVGYTPGVAGDAMLDYMYEQYDVRGEVDGDAEGLVEGEDYIKYDLSYFFDGSLDEYEDVEDAAILYADPDVVNRQLAAQYPEAGILDRLAIMNDFGTEGNAKLLDMWEQVRTNPLPVWSIIVFSVEGVAIIALAFYFVRKKVVRNKLEKIRKQ